MSEHKRLDAVEMMEREHSAILALFHGYHEAISRGDTAGQRRALAEEICMALTIHMRLENEMFYPVLQDRSPHGGLLEEGESEHGDARALISSILRMAADDASCDTQVSALGGWVEHHMRVEGEYLFPAIRLSGINLARLADRLQERRGELQTVADALREDALLPATV